MSSGLVAAATLPGTTVDAVDPAAVGTGVCISCPYLDLAVETSNAISDRDFDATEGNTALTLA
jgi:hypothetical protein